MTKGRYWAFVVYPESLPTDYEDIISSIGIPMAWSPLHDKDINPDGEVKKPHHHCIVYYDNTTTMKSVKENVCDKLNATIPIKLENMRGMYRYHLHLDNPEKYQYEDKDRRFFNGFDTNRVDTLTETEIAMLLDQIEQIIVDKSIMEYSDLIDLLRDDDLVNLKNVSRKNAFYLNTYIKSRRFKSASELQNKKS